MTTAKEDVSTNSSKYVSIHSWLKRHYGKPSKCEFCNKEAKRYEYALIKGMDYDYNRDNFIQLCPSCHRKYDKTFGNIGDIVRGRPPHNIKKVAAYLNTTKQVIEYNSITEAAKNNKISRSSIHAALNDCTKYAGGYKWIYIYD